MTTDDTSTPKPRSRWPLGLVGMLALVVAAERYIEGRNIEFGNMTTIEWRLTSKATDRYAAKADILCFGTSLTRLGVSPLILEERTGLSAYNLALSGSQPYGPYLMLRHALRAGAKPKAIVVEFKWTSVAADPAGLERVLPEIASLPECARLAWDLRDASFLGRVALVKLLPSFAYRVPIRDNITAAVAGKEPVRNEQWFTLARNVRVNKGGYHTPKGNFDGAVETKEPAFFPEDWRPNAVNERYVDKFLTLAESLGVPVFLVIPPISPATRAKLEEVGVTKRYSAFIDGVLARHPVVTALDGRNSNYPAEAFWDASHLNRYGTADLSNALADAIESRLGGRAPTTQITQLSTYRGGKGQERLEDAWDSYLHLTEALKTKDRAAGRVAGGDSGTARR